MFSFTLINIQQQQLFFLSIISKLILNKALYKIQPCLFLLNVILKNFLKAFFLTIIHYIMFTACFITFMDYFYDVTSQSSRPSLLVELAHWTWFKSWMKQFAFHISLIPLGKVGIQLFSSQE